MPIVKLHNKVEVTAKLNNKVERIAMLNNKVELIAKITSPYEVILLLTFVVSDTDYYYIQGATINIDDIGTITTDELGMAHVYIEPGIYDYTITKNGYTTYEGTVSMTNANVVEYIYMELATTAVTINVKDDEGANKSGATVTITGVSSAVTDANGNAVFTLSVGDTYSYSVDADADFIVSTGSLVASVGLTVTVNLLWNFSLDASEWYTNGLAISGVATYADRKSLDLHVKTQIASGTRYKQVRFNPFWGQNFAMARVPLYRSKTPGVTVGNATDVNVGLSSYAVNQGITGNGSGYLNTGVVPSGTSELGLNSSGLMCYYNSLNNITRQLIGSSDNVGTAGRFFLQVNNVTKAYVSYNSDIVGIATTYVNEPNLMLMYRNNSLNYKRLGNGVSLATITATTTAKPDYAIFVFARDTTGVASIPTSQSLATYGIFDSIANDTEAILLSNETNALMTINGRNTY